MRLVSKFLAAAGIAACGLAFAPSASADTLESRQARGMCLDLSTREAVIARCNTRDGQDFRLPRRGYDQIESNRGRCLTAGREGASLTAERCRRNDNGQRWSLERGMLVSASGFCADVDRGDAREGTRVIAYRCHGKDNQIWSVRDGRGGRDDDRRGRGDDRGGRYMEALLSPGHAANMCMDVNGRSKKLQIFRCHGRSNQSFSFRQTDNTELRVDGGCVTMPSNRAAYYVASCDGSRSQRFNFGRDGTIRDSLGQCVGANYNDSKDGTLLAPFRCAGTPAQKWTVRR